MAPNNVRDRYAIVGVGMTPTARTHAPGVFNMTLEAWAARLAIEDAGLRREDIDGAVHGWPASPHPVALWKDSYSRELGLKPGFYMNIQRGGQVAHNGILLAMRALATGQATCVIMACGVSGASGWPGAPGQQAAERSITGLPRRFTQDLGAGRTGLDAVPGEVASQAFYAARHMHEYGTTHEHLGAVALAARAWAQKNPGARYYGQPATMEDYLHSPWTVYPLRDMDCSVFSDLGCALIVTTADRSRNLRRKPVYIKGIGIGDQSHDQWWNKASFTQTAGAHARRQAFEQAGVDLSDIDLTELYDSSTIEVILYMEDYGWCKKGDGGPFVASGAIAPGGSIPVNTHGGFLAGMFDFDLPAVIEAVYQLRGEAGERQVKQAEIALTNGNGGEMLGPGMSSSHAAMVLGNVVS
ncbi:MAG: hypothetical protein HY673_06650 [Chloroflexi bacterium]|nr:hypothetical protein [Chloroflexota bacterium]